MTQRSTHGLTPAPNRTSVSHVLDELREAISSGELPPGTRLIERDLADRFQLSRGPIREAVRALSYEGLVTVRPNRGAVVSAIAAEDVLEVYVLRAVLGSVAIRQLIGADMVTENVVSRLRKLADHAKKASVRGKQASLVDADLAVQQGIMDACGLRRVASRFVETTTEVRMFVATSGVRYVDVDQILKEHDALLAAIRAKDAHLAETLWHERMHTAVKEFLALTPDGETIANDRPWLWQLL
ncbi:MAG: GntR family transcriptional regulator [Streptosporangiales bacterium]|nr:GntR family transcriptional regulator [Streptosporangiales bacterium]